MISEYIEIDKINISYFNDNLSMVQVLWLLKKSNIPHPFSHCYDSMLSNLKINLRKLENKYIHEPNPIHFVNLKSCI